MYFVSSVWRKNEGNLQVAPACATKKPPQVWLHLQGLGGLHRALWGRVRDLMRGREAAGRHLLRPAFHSHAPTVFMCCCHEAGSPDRACQTMVLLAFPGRQRLDLIPRAALEAIIGRGGGMAWLCSPAIRLADFALPAQSLLAEGFSWGARFVGPQKTAAVPVSLGPARFGCGRPHSSLVLVSRERDTLYTCFCTLKRILSPNGGMGKMFREGNH